ncbi:DeoR family transcriptional regulator, partial [Xanthomonas citri pv. citri]
MLASQRQERILAAVRSEGAARVADLVESLDVSDMTVRRDIAELARAGLVRRVHGGAVASDAPGRPTDEPGFEAKRSWAGPE